MYAGFKVGNQQTLRTTQYKILQYLTPGKGYGISPDWLKRAGQFKCFMAAGIMAESQNKTINMKMS